MRRTRFLFACLACLACAAGLMPGAGEAGAADAASAQAEPAPAETAAPPRAAEPSEAPDDAPPAEPQTPEEEVRMLGDYGIAYTTKALQSGAQFYPFAFVMRENKRVQRIAPSELPDFPTQDKLLETLEELLHGVAEEGRYRAVAIVADVVIGMPDGHESEAIQLALEHRECFFRNVFYPYTLSEEGVLTFQKPLSGKRTGRVFTACP